MRTSISRDLVMICSIADLSDWKGDPHQFAGSNNQQMPAENLHGFKRRSNALIGDGADGGGFSFRA